MTTIFFGVLGFTVVILALVMILMVAKAQLVASGEIEIEMNDDPDATLKCMSGSTLLGWAEPTRVASCSTLGRRWRLTVTALTD